MSREAVIIHGQVINRPGIGRVSTLTEEINRTIKEFEDSVDVSSADVKHVNFPSASFGGDALLLFEYEGQKETEKPKKKGRR